MLEAELYLIPFAVLRSSQDDGEYLSERCSLLTVPSLQTLRQKGRVRSKNPTTNGTTNTLVVGSRVPHALAESLGLNETAACLQEAAMVSDLLQAKTLVASNATKMNVLAELTTVECVHFASAISWKLSGIVLNSGDIVDSGPHKRNDMDNENDENNDMISNNVDIPLMNDILLTTDDISNIKLNTKLIVLNAHHSLEPISGIGVSKLSGNWLKAGASAVLLSLWPVPETASKILLRAFYSALLQGTRAAKYASFLFTFPFYLRWNLNAVLFSRALTEAMQTVQHTKHFAHPSNWAGFILIGANIRLSNKVALIGQALCELVKSPERCRDALRVCLHLVRIWRMFFRFLKNQIFIRVLLLFRSKRVFNGSIVAKEMRCTLHRKALKIRQAQ